MSLENYEKLYCRNCDKMVIFQKKYQIFSNGFRHISALCKICGHHLKYLPQGGPDKIYFGKYKGEKYKDIADKDKEYLLWLLEQPWLKDNLRKKIEIYI